MPGQTVANLSLMAMGSSAPEIILSTYATVSKLGTDEKDELGPSTIVGSAAFNLFVIIAVCVVAIPADQERKIAESGLAERFDAIEIVHEKTTGTYETLFARHGDGAARAAMVGNSLKSDILPALQAGSHAVHVPYEITWELERAEEPDGHERFHRLPDLSGLPALLARLRDGATS